MSTTSTQSPGTTDFRVADLSLA
ncbi:MAG: hypothetical protein QOG97_1978, partial [Acidimicrobiaceae bacterium]|nr:hypothetical protein [Acidimicrobiaceae bacterium]